jgi:hypothetical protein
MSNQNPFLQDDLIASIARDTDFIKSKQQSSLQTFLKTQTQKPKINHKPTFNLTNFMSFNFTHFTKFSIAGIAIFTLLAGGLSAQALAPDTLKPTQLAQSIKDKYFSANKQSDGDPGVALVKDENNQLFYVNNCNILVKVPNDVEKKVITSEEFITKQSFSKEFGVSIPNKSMGITEEAKDNFNFSVSCENNDLSNYFKVGDLSFNTLIRTNNLEKINLSKSEFIKETGWFIGETDIDNIYKYTVKNLYEKLEISGYVFKLQNKRYKIESNNATKYLKFSDFQIQFKAQSKKVS